MTQFAVSNLNSLTRFKFLKCLLKCVCKQRSDLSYFLIEHKRWIYAWFTACHVLWTLFIGRLLLLRIFSESSSLPFSFIYFHIKGRDWRNVAWFNLPLINQICLIFKKWKIIICISLLIAFLLLMICFIILRYITIFA